MILVRVSFRYEFTPVPTCSSVFVYVIPVWNVIPVRVSVILVRVHSGFSTGTKRSYRYEIWPHSVPVSCKGGTRFRSGRKWVAELTGTGSECVSIVNNTAKWLVRTRAHRKLRVIPVKWLPCKCGTKLDFVPDRNSYRYHVNTPLWCTPLGRNIISESRSLLFRAKLKIMIQMAHHSSNTSLNIWTLHCVFYKLKAKKQSRIDLYAVVLWPYFSLIL